MRTSFVTLNVARLGVPKGKKVAPDTPEVRDMRQKVADSLVEADGDVVGLQEVRSGPTLDAFLEEHNLDEVYPHRKFFKTNDGGGNHMAILSRFPITATESHRNKPVVVEEGGKERKLTRDVAEADIQIGGVPTKFYVVHLKADPFFENQPTPEEMKLAEGRRLAELETVQRVVAEDLPAMPSKHYVVMGDINDDVGSATAEAFLSDQKVPLVDPHAHLSGPEYLSHPPSQRRLDVTYLSPQLADRVVTDSAEVLPYHEGGSDHRPVKVVVDLQ